MMSPSVLTNRRGKVRSHGGHLTAVVANYGDQLGSPNRQPGVVSHPGGPTLREEEDYMGREHLRPWARGHGRTRRPLLHLFEPRPEMRTFHGSWQTLPPASSAHL